MVGPKMIRLSSVEYFAAALIFGWGLWVLAWGPNAAISAAAFDILRASVEHWGLGPPWRTLGLSSMFVGAIYGLAITINGHGMMWTPIARGSSCVAAVVFLVNLSVTIMQQQPSSTGVLIYMGIAIGYAILFILNLDRFAMSLELIWGRIRGLDT